MKGSNYNYIQDSQFPKQRRKLGYIFKMSIVGLSGGVDLVRRIELGGDLAL